MGLVNTPQASMPMEGATLAAQQKNAPGVYALNAQYSPLYSNLNLSNLDSMLNGSNGNPGLLSDYTNEIMPAMTQAQTTANTAIRTSNLNDAANLSPQYVADERAANPQAAGLLDQLNQGASQQLGYGTQLTPQEQLQFNQSTRGAEAAAGMGYGPSDVFNQALGQTEFGQNLLQQRQGTAQSVAGSLQSFYGNPVAAISGMNAGGGASASQLVGGAGSLSAPAQSSEFNPESSEDSLMMQQEFQGAYGADQGAGQSLTSMTSM